MRTCFCLLLFVVVAHTCHASDQIHNLVERFSTSLANADWDEASACFDGPSLKPLQDLFIDIASKPMPADEQVQFLRSFGGVDTLEAYRALPPRTFFARMLAGAWQQYSDETKQWWPHQKYQVLGSVEEDGAFHIVCRKSVDHGEKHMSLVTILTARYIDGHLLLVSSMDIQATIERMK